MIFKPLVSEEEIREAEAEIEAVAHEIEKESAKIRDNLVFADPEPLRPEIRTRKITPGLKDRCLNFIGFDGRMARIGIANRIARTVDFACQQGIYEASLKRKSRAFDIIVKLYEISLREDTPTSELFITLGWMQALIVTNCPHIRLATVKAI